ncbi:hypothetical protein AB6A40_007422 [Gnathostoma spinigerum]|uniref:G-protein coupled receptors family 1 profile domain-containing protein n=1 Tax=Gnathostoma spinigerum TaxID=75299 RepID=A0ABD6EUJ3_9BILA
MEGDSWWEEHCSVISPEPERLIIVGFIGSILATVSAIFNAFLFYSLLSIPSTLHCHLLYLTLLAFFDTFLSGSYILLFPVNVFMDFFESEFLTHCWYAYLRIMLAACHVAISTSALLITTAAFERYLIIVHRRFQFRESHRIMISALTLIFALICKAPMYFEVEVCSLAK